MTAASRPRPHSHRYTRRLIAATFAAAAAAAAAISAIPVSAASNPTDVEQYALELINRARFDPTREAYLDQALAWGDTGAPHPPDLNEGLSFGTISFVSKPALAFNTNLIQSARDYSNTLLNNNALTETFGGTSPTSRAAAAGYTAPATFGETLAVSAGPAPYNISQAVADLHQSKLFIDANTPGRVNRINVLNTNYKEIGIGFGQKSGYTFFGPPANAVLSVYDLGSSPSSAGGKAFVTGVVYNDTLNDNNFYDVGEGLPGVSISAVPTPGGPGGVAASTTTFSTGGYSLPLDPGTYDVTISGGGLGAPLVYNRVAVASNNVKLDAATDQGVWAVNASGDWATPSNWSGVVPIGAGKTATFAGKGIINTITASSDTTVGRIVFDNGFPYTIATSGSAKLILDGGAPGVVARIDDINATHTISANLQLNDPLEVSVMTTFETLNLTGSITPNGAGKSLTKFGFGNLRLAGDNSALNAPVNIVLGTLTVSNSHALGSGPVTIGFGSSFATLQLDTAGLNIANPFTIQGVTNIRTSYPTGTTTLSGPMILTTGTRITIADANAALQLNGPIGEVSGASAGFSKDGPGTLILNGVNTFHGLMAVNAGTLILNGTIPNSSTLFVSGGLCRLGADQTTHGLTVFKESGAALDLNGHAIHVLTFPGNVLTNIRSDIATTNGTQPGIFDSTGISATTIGYMPIGNTEVLVKKALAGDANLDGTVGFTDLVAIAQHYNTTTGDAFWFEGDFTHDGNVDFNDLVKLAQNYNATLASAAVPGASSDFERDLARAFASVPEPGGISLLLAACGFALPHRRRNRSAPPRDRGI